MHSDTPTPRFSRRMGQDVKTVQDLLRHANSFVTMNLYAQAFTQAKRQAQSRLVSMLLDDNSTKQSTALNWNKTEVRENHSIA